jgi:hypothetical protein
VTRKLFNCAAAVSLLLCVTAAVLWFESYRFHGRVGFSTSDARYTFHSHQGHLIFTRPPDAGPQTPLAWQMAGSIKNDDVVLTGVTHPNRGVPHWVYLVRIHWKPESGTHKMLKVFDFRTGMTSPARPLLKALEDPDRAAAAHVLLRFIKQGYLRSPSERNGDWITVMEDEGLPVRFRWSELKEERERSQILVAPAKADPSAWRNLRDLWHDRLDVQVFSISNAWLVVITAICPVIWIIRFSLKRCGHGRGRCVSCGYNLTGNTSGVCPECGTTVPRKAEARA